MSSAPSNGSSTGRNEASEVIGPVVRVVAVAQMMGEAGLPCRACRLREAQPPELRPARRQDPERVRALEGRAVVVAELDVDRIDDPGIHPVREDLELEEPEVVGRVDVERPVGGLGGGDVVGQLLADPARSSARNDAGTRPGTRCRAAR